MKATCRKRAEYNLELAKYDFEMPPTLEETEVAAIFLPVVLTISRRLRTANLLAESPEPRTILILIKMTIFSHNPVTDDNERAVAKLPPDMSKAR